MTLGENSIRFDFDKSEIEPQYRDILNRIAGVLMTLKGYSIYVYGYTDDIGHTGLQLEAFRPTRPSCPQFLVRAGINPGALSPPRGLANPTRALKGDAPQARAANRRVGVGIVDSRLLFEPLPESKIFH